MFYTVETTAYIIAQGSQHKAFLRVEVQTEGARATDLLNKVINKSYLS